MPLLNQPLQLWNIKDTEAFCRRIIDNHIKSTRSPLGPDDYDEALSHLITEAWIASNRFTPTTPTVKFSPYAHRILSFRIIDWRRQSFRTRWQFADSTYERDRIDPLSLDHQSPNGHRLADTLTAPAGDPAADSDTDLRRALRTRGSDEAWRHHPDRQRLPSRAA
jgi:hypothetical protein